MDYPSQRREEGKEKWCDKARRLQSPVQVSEARIAGVGFVGLEEDYDSCILDSNSPFSPPRRHSMRLLWYGVSAPMYYYTYTLRFYGRDSCIFDLFLLFFWGMFYPFFFIFYWGLKGGRCRERGKGWVKESLFCLWKLMKCFGRNYLFLFVYMYIIIFFIDYHCCWWWCYCAFYYPYIHH